MKKALILISLVLITLSAYTAEPKALSDIDIESMMADTTFVLTNMGENDFALAFWLPQEFWMSIFSQDPSVSTEDSRAIIDVIEGLSILAVAQADVSALGSFNFYPEKEIRSGMSVTYTGENGRPVELVPKMNIDPDLEMILMIFRQIFGGAMGRFGENLQYFVIADQDHTGGRIVDPYLNGSISIEMTKRNEGLMSSEMDLPLNSLYIPRKCPNGKDAHISWIYCPWTGIKLDD